MKRRRNPSWRTSKLPFRIASDEPGPTVLELPATALESHPIDGSLAKWRDLQACGEEWAALLLGNGLSRHVWGAFGYASLFDTALETDGPSGLNEADRALFTAAETSNFERVLGDLAAAIRVSRALGLDVEAFGDRYRHIQFALGAAVRRIHAGRNQIPTATLEAIGTVMRSQECVFTTNYDLVAYWAMGAVGYADLCDCFWGRHLCFDPTSPDVPPLSTPVYFLHGALHLVVNAAGRSRKLASGNLGRLLEQFGHADAEGDEHPLLVTEGSWREKLRAIEANDYLAYALERLRGFERPIVVFGSDLGEQDQHLVDALNRRPERPVAVSIRRAGKSAAQIRAVQARLRGCLEAEPLLFFDSATHPLGLPALAGV